ncbi:MAG TPA: TonB family protein [Ramlibacter sp.]|nr:TonB family protein [Ramlibacter sp.]
MPPLNRNIIIVGGVVLFHVAALWALQSGLIRRVVEVVVPVAVLSDIAPSPPEPKPATPVEVKPPVPTPPEPRPVQRRLTEPVQQTSPPVPVTLPEPSAGPPEPMGIRSMMRAPEPVTAAAPAPAPAPARVELPSSAAEYLQNPQAVYPPISKRLGEQGNVLVRVLIGADGVPQRAELKRSSGFDRLDKAALDHVMKCRYVPGKVGGVPQAMWYDAPVNFVLE